MGRASTGTVTALGRGCPAAGVRPGDPGGTVPPSIGASAAMAGAFPVLLTRERRRFRCFGVFTKIYQNQNLLTKILVKR